MLANNVQETTTTTGTGNITLAGASEDGQTFTSQFMTDQRFSYFIDDRAGNWETGIGYLSASTTLVRTKPINGSAAVPVSFAAGTKFVYVAPSAECAPLCAQSQSLTGTLDTKCVRSAHLTRNGVATHTIAGTRVQFAPFKLDYACTFDAFLASVKTTGAAGDIFCALYTIADGLPDKLVVTHATSLDPEVSGVQTGTFTAQAIPAGWYFIAVTCDVNVGVLGDFGNYSVPPHLGSDSGDLFDFQWAYYIDGSFTTFPATIGAESWTVSATSNPFRIMLRPTA